ncbi:MAG: hypothetical protein CM1200mP20_17400 [Pseudomonadota bacterium]|nr:MAG: hypothetical protein CM1200mP20_17400 [Pseudomonadota bacterium]
MQHIIEGKIRLLALFEQIYGRFALLRVETHLAHEIFRHLNLMLRHLAVGLGDMAHH